VKPISEEIRELLEFAKKCENEKVRDSALEMVKTYGYKMEKEDNKRFIIFLVQVVLIFLLALIAVLGGVYYANLESSSEINIMGFYLKTQNVGIGLVFIGMALAVVCFRNVNKYLKNL